MTTWNRLPLRCPKCNCCPQWVCALARLNGTRCWEESPDRLAAAGCPCAPRPEVPGD